MEKDDKKEGILKSLMGVSLGVMVTGAFLGLGAYIRQTTAKNDYFDSFPEKYYSEDLAYLKEKLNQGTIDKDLYDEMLLACKEHAAENFCQNDADYQLLKKINESCNIAGSIEACVGSLGFAGLVISSGLLVKKREKEEEKLETLYGLIYE